MTSLALVLIAAPGRLDDAAVDEACALFARGDRTAPNWLGPGEACEITQCAASDREAEELRARVESAIADGMLEDRSIDLAIVPGRHRRKKLLVADMESTIIEQECLDELAAFAGIGEKIAAITDRAMRGDLEFEAALRARVGLLAGLPDACLARVMDERVSLMPGARTLVGTMRAHGAFAALVSGGFSYFARRVAADVGFDAYQSNDLVIAGGKLTGEVAEPILGREAKRAALESHAARLGIGLRDALAVGDGANDLDMIRAAGLGVAFRAKPRVASAARVSIEHGDLTALLYLQGYRRDEFVR